MFADELSDVRDRRACSDAPDRRSTAALDSFGCGFPALKPGSGCAVSSRLPKGGCEPGCAACSPAVETAARAENSEEPADLLNACRDSKLHRMPAVFDISSIFLYTFIRAS